MSQVFKKCLHVHSLTYVQRIQEADHSFGLFKCLHIYSIILWFRENMSKYCFLISSKAIFIKYSLLFHLPFGFKHSHQ